MARTGVICNSARFVCAARATQNAERKETTVNTYEARLTRVIDHIHDHPAGDLSLDALADVAALSRFHFHRLFRAVIGETAAQSVRRVRMQKASFALVMGDHPIPRIARDVGYPNAASFVRTFTEAFSMSPQAFRKRGELRPFHRNPAPEMTLMYPVEIRHEPARRLAAMPHRGVYFEINRAFEKLSTAMAARDLFAHARHMIGVFYDDPTSVKPEDLRSHAAFEITSDVPLTAPIEEVHLPAGRQAVLTYKGPYAGLPAAYDQLYAIWLPKSAEEPADHPAFEVYLNSPMNTAPDDLLTELHLPLRSA
jgi:AraC family transcriptional regulator